MLILNDKILDDKALGEIMDGKEDIKLYNIDKENNIIQLEAIGGNLADLTTEYEIINDYDKSNFEGKEQFFVIDVGLNDYKPRKFTVITKDSDGNVIHTQDISARLSVVETKSIIEFIKSMNNE